MLAAELHAHSKGSTDGRDSIEQLLERAQTVGVEMVGQARTLVDTDERTTERILAARRDGRTTVQGRRTPYQITSRQVAGSATRRARHQLF